MYFPIINISNKYNDRSQTVNRDTAIADVNCIEKYVPKITPVKNNEISDEKNITSAISALKKIQRTSTILLNSNEIDTVSKNNIDTSITSLHHNHNILNKKIIRVQTPVTSTSKNQNKSQQYLKTKYNFRKSTTGTNNIITNPSKNIVSQNTKEISIFSIHQNNNKLNQIHTIAQVPRKSISKL